MKLQYIAQTSEDEALLQQIRQILQKLPPQGQEQEAYPHIRLIYEGRNKLYQIQLGVQTFVVKCFAKPSLLPRLYYSFVGRTKAERSHLYALALRERAVAVPESVGYIVERNSWGFITHTYYVSHALDSDVPNIQPHARGWASPEGFMPALADYLLHCHNMGVEHLDLSPGNILYRYDAERGSYHFAMVDLNRMKLHNRPLSLNTALQNLVRLMNTRSVSRSLAYFYAVARGTEVEQTEQCLQYLTDVFWRKRWLKLSMRYARRKYGLSLLGFMQMYLTYRWALLRGNKERAEHLYRLYLQREDIRHIERRRRGFSYRYTD